MHWIEVMPLEKSPFCATRKGYSNTKVPLGKRDMKKLVAASPVLS
jgi:hypothetical protein